MQYAGFTYENYGVSPSYLARIREYYGGIEYLSPKLYKNVCRYKKLRTIQDEDGKIYHESWNQKFIEKSSEDQYCIVDEKSKDRLDIISAYYYGTPRYWWVIALANYLIDPFFVPIGTRLRVPPISSLYVNGGIINE